MSHLFTCGNVLISPTVASMSANCMCDLLSLLRTQRDAVTNITAQSVSHLKPVMLQNTVSVDKHIVTLPTAPT